MITALDDSCLLSESFGLIQPSYRTYWASCPCGVIGKFFQDEGSCNIKVGVPHVDLLMLTTTGMTLQVFMVIPRLNMQFAVTH